MGFRVGDKVLNGDFGEGIIKAISKHGTYYAVEFEYAVQFDEHTNGFHSCQGICEDGYGWWCTEQELKKIEEECNMEFKFGDRVKHKKLGIGTIKYGVDDSYAVEFDKKQSHLHTCGQICKDYHGWWCTGEELEYAHEKTFAVGDRVYSHGFGYGTVKKISDCGSFYAVEFDKPHDKLHSCGGYTKLNRGWWCHPKELELVTLEEPVVKTKVKVEVQTRKIYSRTLPNYVASDVEKLTIQEPYVIVELETGEKGRATCHKDDKFDEVTGFNIAYRRALVCKAENDKVAEIEEVTNKYNSLIKELQDEIYFLGLDEDAFNL